ncbi:MAG: cupredoxin family copper-binding protein [Dehalococcoidales bacterium]
MMKRPRSARAGLTGIIIGFALLLIALFGLASCQPTTPAPAPAPVPSPTVEVEISGFAFKPDTLTVPPGTTVTWTNLDGPAHTVTTRETRYDSKLLPTGDTFSYTFEQNGTYEYYCTIHPFMTATIIVE